MLKPNSKVQLHKLPTQRQGKIFFKTEQYGHIKDGPPDDGTVVAQQMNALCLKLMAYNSINLVTFIPSLCTHSTKQQRLGGHGTNLRKSTSCFVALVDILKRYCLSNSICNIEI
ncbi:hypothetical protein VNO78_23408 [Psophocarpus tetragonolobus]|uniref:Uncharacterized protein n=1 Tax=Psophocarpus tetragonolobus TaxID=3891 RepID=A0AAN9XDU2_PSOTE